MNAVRLHADYRPLVGLTPADAGTLEELVLSHAVIGAAVKAHNEDVDRAK